jgi:hypothetical protein
LTDVSEELMALTMEAVSNVPEDSLLQENRNVE